MRRDDLKDSYTLVAPQRRRRPATPSSPAAGQAAGNLQETACSLCAGREDETPPAVLTLPASGEWRVRVVPNLFPIVPGAHELVIETPVHGLTLAAEQVEQVELVLAAIQTRVEAMYQRSETLWVQPFRNQGAMAGASLEHSHAQIVALPFLPPPIARKSAKAQPPECAYCRLVAAEAAGPRFVTGNDSFVAFCPEAPSWEGEVWIVAQEHVRTLPYPGTPSARNLALALRDVLGAVETCAPAHNLMIFGGSASLPFHFHIEITPRPADAIKAGLELATGVAVVREPPELSAAAYRAALRSSPSPG